jgi:peptide/nickel transport system permease protein
MVWARLYKNPFAVLGLVILLITILAAIFAPLIAVESPIKMNIREAMLPTGSPNHPLGTDDLGRDVLSRLIYGSRVSLQVGLIVVGISATVGVTLGAISGYYGGVIDNIIMRFSDIMQAFPFLVLALAVVSIVGASLTNMMIVLGAVSWVDYARLMRGMVLVEREKEYIQSAQAIGARDSRIIFHHILPNCLSTILVQATFGVASAILVASSLSFLGMGAQPPTPEWGAMLNAARPFLRDNPMLSVVPGVAIMLTVLSINFIGDALRDALDPRLVQHS